MNFVHCKAFLADLDRHTERVQLHHAELESGISWLMDEIHRLAQAGADDDHKMQLVAIKYRARLLLERWRKLGVNWEATMIRTALGIFRKVVIVVLTLAAVGTVGLGVNSLVEPIRITFSSDAENGAYLGLRVEDGFMQGIRSHVVAHELLDPVIHVVLDHSALGNQVIILGRVSEPWTSDRFEVTNTSETLEFTWWGDPPPSGTHIQERAGVHLLLLFVVVATYPTITFIRGPLRRRRRRRKGLCLKCAYDLRATPERCPECGKETDAKG